MSSFFSGGITTWESAVLEKGVHFIQKPFRMKDLTRKIHEAIREK